MPPQAKAFLGCFVVLVLLYLLASACAAIGSSLGDDGSQSPGEAGGAVTTMKCPERVVDKLPGRPTALVEAAYRTQNKQIILCRTEDGDLYYHGEYTDRPDTAQVMSAEPTGDGYSARNGPYSYEIDGDQVIVSHNGEEIGREDLTPDANPS